VEASLQHEAKATAKCVLTLVVLHKQRRRCVYGDIHVVQTGPVVRDSPNLHRDLVLSGMEGDRWQVTITRWRGAGGARKSLTKNQSGYNGFRDLPVASRGRGLRPASLSELHHSVDSAPCNLVRLSMESWWRRRFNTKRRRLRNAY
jgi:hypothetical protein